MPDLSRMTERQPIPGALLSDININLVRDHIDTAIKRRGYDGPTEPEEYLMEHGCLQRGVDGMLTPTLAGIVAFGREPHRHVSVCGIDIAQFSGPRPNTTDLVLSRQIRGDLMTIIDRAVDLLWARTDHRTHIVGTERVEEQAYPLVVLRELTSHEQIAALERKQIDIGILHGPLAEPHIDLECILRQPLWVALPRGHAFAERATIHLTELRNETFILASHEHEPALHDRYLSICQQAGFVPQAIQEASQMQTILGLVALDLGVFLVAAYVRNFPHSGVAYVPIAEPAPWVDLYAAWHQRSRSPVLQQFWSVLKEVAAPQ